MIFRLLSPLGRVRITLGYALVLVTVSAVLVELGPRVRAHVIALASTNLHNLAHGHVATLFGSAFVTDAGPIWFWLPCLVCLLALAELMWRSGRLALVFVTGHVGATLLVAVGLTAAIELGWLPLSISRASDVGVSYGALAVLGALTAAVPRRWRPIWLGWWLPVGIVAAILNDDFTDVGHSIALALGMLVS
ncbi:MAG TPA: rhomboid-like protein, partial [Mycobacterium sp.]|uniref:rhomboid-like protein n=1 Tax=Mycobacterium sp. TaxID=1785 RepID=UPI002C93D8B3